MGLTLYLFGASRRVRAVITQGISECLHSEHDYTLRAEIPLEYAPQPGEHIGLRCADERFRLFEIDTVEDDEARRASYCTCTDAAVAELVGTIVHRIDAAEATAGTAAEAILAGTGYGVDATTDGIYPVSIKVFAGDAWSALKDVAYDGDVRVIPHFGFADGEIKGKTVSIEAKESVFRGRIIEEGADAHGVTITRDGSPRPMIYGLGATDENDEQLTFADIEWSVANGDPVDKPKGQAWIGVPEAVAAYPGKGQIYELAYCKDANQLIALAWKKAQRAARPSIGAQATVSDMALMPGQSWKTIRLYDAMAVITARGEAVRKTVIEILRDYVHPQDTRVTLGEEDERPPNIAREIARIEKAAIRAGRGGGGAGAAAARNYYLLSMQDAKVEDLRTILNTVYIELDAINARLTLKAEHSDLVAQIGRINEAMIRLDATDAAIALKASVTDVDDQGRRISAAELEIDGLNSEIELKADKVTIDAQITEINNLLSGKSTIALAAINTLRASFTHTAYLYLNNEEASWKSFKAVTGGSVTFSTVTVSYMKPDGTEGTLRIPASFSFSPTTDWIYYLGK